MQRLNWSWNIARQKLSGNISKTSKIKASNIRKNQNFSKWKSRNVSRFEDSTDEEEPDVQWRQQNHFKHVSVHKF